MSSQLSLSGFEPARPTDRLFLRFFQALRLPCRSLNSPQRLRSKHALKGKPLATERFHVTLHHLGDYAGLSQGLVDAAREAGAAVATPPFDVLFDRAGSFVGRPRNRPFVLRGSDGVAALAAFQQSLGTTMKNAGLWRRVESHFTPHVTLLYDDRFVEEQPVEGIGWTVHELVLVHSLLGRTEHVVLDRWPLPSISPAAG